MTGFSPLGFTPLGTLPGVGANAYTLTADAASFALTGTAAALKAGRVIIAGNAPPCYWNPSDKAAGITLSNGDLTATSTSGTNQNVRSNVSHASGKWYYEITMIGTTKVAIGVANAAKSLTEGAFATTNSIGYYSDGGVGYGGGAVATYATYTGGDVIGIAVDVDAGKVWFSKNGTWQSGDPGTGSGGISIASGSPLYALFNAEPTGASLTANFGATAFNTAAPSGFSAWDQVELFALTGSNVTLRRGIGMVAGGGSFTLTGTDTGLRIARRLVADSGTFVLTGTNALVSFGGRLEAGSGAFTLQGGDATLTFAGGTQSLSGRRIKERKPNRRGKVIVFPDELPPEEPEETEAPVAPPAPSGPLGIGEAVKALSGRLAALQAQIAQAEAVARQRRRQQARIDALKAEIGRVEIELQAAIDAEQAWIARLRDDDEFFLLAA